MISCVGQLAMNDSIHSSIPSIHSFILMFVEIVERELAAAAEQRKKERAKKVQERKKQLEAEGHATEEACTLQRGEKRVWR